MTQKQRMLVPFSFLADEDDFMNFPALNPSKNSDMSIWEDESTVTAEVAVPGLSTKDIDVHYDKGVLTIRGSKQESEEDKKKKYYRKMSQSYTYQMTVPSEIEPNSEHAQLKDGILKVTFKKHKKEQPRKIQIQQG